MLQASRESLVYIIPHQDLLTTSISPLSLVIPAKSHPEVIVQAVAARDRSKAEAFAKSHGIPEVKETYQGWCCSLRAVEQQALTTKKKIYLTIRTSIVSSSRCQTACTTNGPFVQFVLASMSFLRSLRHRTQPKPRCFSICLSFSSQTPR